MSMDRHFKRCKPLPGEDGYGCHWIGTAIAAGSSIFGGLMGKSAAEDAAEAQQEALERQIGFQREMYEQQRADAAPWREAGGRAVNRLEYLLGLGDAPGTTRDTTTTTQVANPQRAALERELAGISAPAGGEARDIYFESAQGQAEQARAAQIREQLASMPETISQTTGGVETVAGDPDDPAFGSLMRSFTEEDFRADPGYQFRLSEGEKALNRAAAARGMYSNPATVRELQRFGQGVADQTYNDAFNRFQLEQGNRFNRLASLSGMGQTGVNQTMGAAQNFANTAGNAMGNIGAAQSAGILSGANAMIQGLTGAGAGIGNQFAFNRGYGSIGQQPVNIGYSTPAYGGGMSRGAVSGMGYRP